MTTDVQDRGAVQERLDALKWYHSIDVPSGATTRGWWDLRHALDLLPLPDVSGKRCLDIGTWDGFYAYEMERRGAAEVVAIDVPDLTQLDYPPETLADESFDPSAPETEQRRGAGFGLLHDLLGSRVERREINIYDLDPDDVGSFDVVMLGSLLVHLRDPVRALDAVRKVTRGQLVMSDYVHLPSQLRSRKRPLFELRARSNDFQWWMANDAGLRHLLYVGGFEVEAVSKFFLLRRGELGKGFPDDPAPFRRLRRRLLHAAYSRDWTPGAHLQRAYRARPRF